ncbi:MAG: hypothetical protein COW65_17500 [Cytophagales bacterium CG18_big_fil_WC_8_21_14_2_50_42_9]|nr:MAG: hypothetical protein COW65_17500 [Cytophagales bacterium CG18_big_fil_WC_8_21_14_2_50_42_9]
MKRINLLFWSLLLSLSLTCCDNSKAGNAEQDNSKKESKKNKSGKKGKADTTAPEVTIIEKWEMPGILREISGIAYLGKNQFACVQDESGVIFIYNTATKKIDRQITFGATGDYEGIALVGRTAYVLRSNGKIFEVNNIDTQSPKIKEYDTPLTSKNDVEGLTYDAKNNRLLLAIKGAETNTTDYKGIYAFNLKTKQLSAQPVLKLSLSDPMLQESKSKKPENSLQPSDIAVNPQTGEIYLTESANAHLLILNADGSIKERYALGKDDFSQPEGITFSPSGDVFISNEGKKEKGNILQVSIQ